MSTRYKIKDVRCEQPGDGFDMLLLVGEVTYETDNGETFIPRHALSDLHCASGLGGIQKIHRRN